METASPAPSCRVYQGVAGFRGPTYTGEDRRTAATVGDLVWFGWAPSHAWLFRTTGCWRQGRHTALYCAFSNAGHRKNATPVPTLLVLLSTLSASKAPEQGNTCPRWDSTLAPDLEYPPLPWKHPQSGPVRPIYDLIRSPGCAHCAHPLFCPLRCPQPGRIGRPCPAFSRLLALRSWSSAYAALSRLTSRTRAGFGRWWVSRQEVPGK